MAQIIFNSFPRSANVYLGHVASKILLGMHATVHIPEIFKLEELNNVTVFRKPEDALASLINKFREVEGNIMDKIHGAVNNNMKLYETYITYAAQNSDHVYIAEFEDIISNTVRHFEEMSRRFDMPLAKNYEEIFSKIDLTGNLWSDRYDGHIPREKDEDRLFIESYVRSMEPVQELNEKFYDFVSKYAIKLS